jgi:hypothetical protein
MIGAGIFLNLEIARKNAADYFFERNPSLFFEPCVFAHVPGKFHELNIPHCGMKGKGLF